MTRRNGKRVHRRGTRSYVPLPWKKPVGADQRKPRSQMSEAELEDWKNARNHRRRKRKELAKKVEVAIARDCTQRETQKVLRERAKREKEAALRASGRDRGKRKKTKTE